MKTNLGQCHWMIFFFFWQTISIIPANITDVLQCSFWATGNKEVLLVKFILKSMSVITCNISVFLPTLPCSSLGWRCNCHSNTGILSFAEGQGTVFVNGTFSLCWTARCRHWHLLTLLKGKVLFPPLAPCCSAERQVAVSGTSSLSLCWKAGYCLCH